MPRSINDVLTPRLLALAFVATAQLPSMTVIEPPRAGNARVVLTTAKPEFFIGQNILIHYCVENTSAIPFSVSFGGDYRGGSRSNRFKVTVTSAGGAVAPDPDPAGMNLGGIGGTVTVIGSERWCESLPLSRYARIDQAGDYVVRVYHDLGWTKTPPPRGELKISIAMPAPEQIPEVVAAMLALPARNSVFGRLSLATAQSLKAVLYGVKPSSPLVMAAALAAIAIAATVAAIGPAWRAGRVDPVKALKAR